VDAERLLPDHEYVDAPVAVKVDWPPLGIEVGDADTETVGGAVTST